MNIVKSFLLTVVSTLSATALCMEMSNNANQFYSLAIQQPAILDLNVIPTEADLNNFEKIQQKVKTIKWLRTIIQPLNAGRFNPSHK